LSVKTLSSLANFDVHIEWDNIKSGVARTKLYHWSETRQKILLSWWTKEISWLLHKKDFLVVAQKGLVVA
jgi:hypothetical protein